MNMANKNLPAGLFYGELGVKNSEHVKLKQTQITPQTPRKVHLVSL